jgi:5-methylcytosine-specific restriction protein A
MIKKNIGILASMSWNSNNWASRASNEDIENSNYDYVKEKGEMHEDLNFGHEVLPAEDNGKFIASIHLCSTPILQKKNQNMLKLFSLEV